MNKKAAGNIGEQIAVEYLQRKGYTVLERNVKYAGVEVDIIAEFYAPNGQNEPIVANLDRASVSSKNFGDTVREGKENLYSDGNPHLKTKLSERIMNGFFQNRRNNIAKSHRTIVFCEVKTRGGDVYGNPLETITGYQIGRYITAAKNYIARNRAGNDNFRFDVICVLDGEIEHIISAFDQNDAKFSRRRV